MILTFIKKRWFSIALVIIVLAAMVRRNLRIQVGSPSARPKQEQPEKYTHTPSAAPGASMLGLAPGGAPAGIRLPEIDDATSVAFLKRFSQVAVQEQQKFGMPASVLLACAYVNGFAGSRDCAREANNFLAIPCTAKWGGPVATFSGICFRKYNTPWESIRDFNLYLSARDWYAPLKKSAPRNWRDWAKALAAHRVSDVENLETELVRVIEKYRLFELDEG